MEVDVQGLLFTSAEIAVAFVGFASLAGAFIARGAGALPFRLRAGLRGLLDYGLLAVFACFVPFFPFIRGASGSEVWVLSSVVLVIFSIGYIAFSHYFYRELIADTSNVTYPMIAGDAITILLLSANALGWPFESGLLVYYFAGVAWNVIGAAASFRIVLTQVWNGES